MLGEKCVLILESWYPNFNKITKVFDKISIWVRLPNPFLPPFMVGLFPWGHLRLTRELFDGGKDLIKSTPFYLFMYTIRNGYC